MVVRISNYFSLGESLVKSTANAQQVIDRLAERVAKADRLPVKCTLGRKPLQRSGGGCSACTTPREGWFSAPRLLAPAALVGTLR